MSTCQSCDHLDLNTVVNGSQKTWKTSDPVDKIYGTIQEQRAYGITS